MRDKKALLSDQCKEIEDSNRIGKTQDLFKKIRDKWEYFIQVKKKVKSLIHVLLFATSWTIAYQGFSRQQY